MRHKICPHGDLFGHLSLSLHCLCDVRWGMECVVVSAVCCVPCNWTRILPKTEHVKRIQHFDREPNFKGTDGSHFIWLTMGPYVCMAV